MAIEIYIYLILNFDAKHFLIKSLIYIFISGKTLPVKLIESKENDILSRPPIPVRKRLRSPGLEEFSPGKTT